jgi:hypothetical protein
VAEACHLVKDVKKQGAVGAAEIRSFQVLAQH